MQLDQASGGSEPVQSVMMNPPTQPGPLVVAESRSSWPIALGVIAIILAVLYLLVNAISLVATQSSLSDSSAGSPVGTRHILYGPVVTVASSVVATMLLVAGIGLIARRAWSRVLILTWAVVDLIETIAGLVVGVSQTQQELAAASSGGAAMPFGILEGMLIGGLACGVLPGFAFPIFSIVWFSRAKIKQEIASWRGAARA